MTKLIFPSSDIHLTLDEVIEDVTIGQDLMFHSDTHGVYDIENFNISNPTVVSAAYREENGRRFIRLMPLAVGVSWIQVPLLNHLQGRNEQLIKVTVHSSISRIWIGNNRATIFEDQDNYVLSVYAEFSDIVIDIVNEENLTPIISVGDITGHFGLVEHNNGNWNFVQNGRYLTYSNNDNNGFQINNLPNNLCNDFIEFGRVSGVTANTTWNDIENSTIINTYQATISIAFTNNASPNSSSINIYVLPSLVNPIENTVTFIPFPNNSKLNDIDNENTEPQVGKTNILFIAEGFRSTDRNQFSERSGLLYSILDDWFTNDDHQPLKLLQEDFNIWALFLPSSEEGITAACGIHKPSTGNVSDNNCTPLPLDDSVSMVSLSNSNANFILLIEVLTHFGEPNENTFDISNKTAVITSWINNTNISINNTIDGDVIYNVWKKYYLKYLPQAKDTIFGFCLSERYCEKKPSNASYDADKKYYTPSPDFANRTILIDQRRNNSDQNILDQIIGSCKYGSDPNDPFYNITERFINPESSDYGLSSFVCNEVVRAGTQVGNSFAATLGDNNKYSLVVGVNGQDNFKSNTITIVNDRFILRSSGVFAHELAHSNKFGLLDEYDGTNSGLNSTEILYIKNSFNTCYINEIRKTTPNNANLSKPITASNIKWNPYRIKSVIKLINNSTRINDSEILVNVDSINTNFEYWQIVADNNLDVFITTANPNYNFASYMSLGKVVPLRIIDINSNTGEIRLSLFRPTSLTIIPESLLIQEAVQFSEGDYLFIPLKGPSKITSIEISEPGIALKDFKLLKFRNNLKIKSRYGYSAKAKVSSYLNGSITGITIKNEGKNYIEETEIEIKGNFKRDKKLLKKIQEEQNDNNITFVSPILKPVLTLLNTSIIGVIIKDNGLGYNPQSPPSISIYGGSIDGSNVSNPATFSVVFNPKPDLTFEINTLGEGYSVDYLFRLKIGEQYIQGINSLKVIEVDSNGGIMQLRLNPNFTWDIDSLKDSNGEYQIPILEPWESQNMLLGTPTITSNIVVSLTNKIGQINIVNSGSGYVRLPVVVVDPPPNSINSKRAIIEPIVGCYSRLIDHSILTHMNNNESAIENIPTNNCGEPRIDFNRDTLFPQFASIPESEIDNVVPYSFGYNVIAIYEGAATFNCETYRPSGISKLRKSNYVFSGKLYSNSFNYVSQYLMVSKVNPSKLNELDRLIYKKDLKHRK